MRAILIANKRFMVISPEPRRLLVRLFQGHEILNGLRFIGELTSDAEYVVVERHSDVKYGIEENSK